MEIYESAESGISPLIVVPITTQKIEEGVRQEEAAAESQGTRTQSEALEIKNQIQGAHQETGMYDSYICCIIVGIVYRCVPSI